MATHEYVCPNCSAIGRSVKALPAGTAIRCRKCNTVYHADEGPGPAPPPAPPSRHQRPDSAAEPPRRRPVEKIEVLEEVEAVEEVRVPSRRRFRDDDDDDDRYDRDDDRPRRKKRGKAGKGGTSAVTFLAAGAALFLIIAGVIVIGMFAFNSDKDKNKFASPIPPGSPGFPGMSGMPDGSGFPGAPPVDPGRNLIVRAFNQPPELQEPVAGTGREASRPGSKDVRTVLDPPRARPAKSLEAPDEVVQLSGDVRNRVTRATAYLRVTSDKGLMFGSGFFAGSVKDIVVTNAHVVGMLDADAPVPSKIEVVLNSGEADEVIFRGEVLTVDRVSDLAVLRIHPLEGAKKASFPPSLSVALPTSLRETQQVFIFGFPLGEQLGKNITIAKSSITSLRKASDGVLEQIQVGGGMHPGNSGGPVVDANGNLVGVAVAVIRGTQINFAIPAERVSSILDGRLTTVTLGDPVLRESQLVVPVELETHDPLSRIKGLSVDWWWGDAKDKVPATRGTAPVISGSRQKLDVKSVSPIRYSAELLLARDVPANKTLWLQARYTNGSGETLFVQGIAKDIDPLPEARNATLTYRPRVGEAKVTLQNAAHMTLRASGGQPMQVVVNVNTTLTEKTSEVSNDGRATVSVTPPDQADKFVVTLSENGRASPRPPDLDKALNNINQMALNLSVDRYGTVVRAAANVTNVPIESQTSLSRFAAQMIQSLDLAAPTFPNGEVRPGQRWRNERQIPMVSLSHNGNEVADVYYTYRGVRKVDGQEMAIVTLSGRLSAGSASGQPGSVNGTLWIDVAQGRVVKAHATVESAIQAFDPGENGQFEMLNGQSRLELRLARQ